ncbi:F0F1 ATP synthase subunit epsilon, partial [Limosilactobacillus reuteri]
MAENTFKVTIITTDSTVNDNDKITMLDKHHAGGQMGIIATNLTYTSYHEISTDRINTTDEPTQ